MNEAAVHRAAPSGSAETALFKTIRRIHDYALVQVPEVAAASSLVPAGLLGATLLLAFAWHERRSDHPLVPSRLLTVPGLVAANVAAAAIPAGLAAVLYIGSLYLQRVAQYSAWETGLAFLPTTVALVVVSLLAPGWVARIGARWAALGGLPCTKSVAAGCELSPKPASASFHPADTLKGMNVRMALPDELDAICDFGATYIRDHYEPLLGWGAAQAQVDDWWTRERMSRAIDESRVVVAEEQGEILGVAEWSLHDQVPVIWKLYVHPSRRNQGIGPLLIAAIIDQLPEGTGRLRVETFAVNQRAREFYEREGFREVRTVEHSNPIMNVIWFERSLDPVVGEA